MRIFLPVAWGTNWTRKRLLFLIISDYLVPATCICWLEKSAWHLQEFQLIFTAPLCEFSLRLLFRFFFFSFFSFLYFSVVVVVFQGILGNRGSRGPRGQVGMQVIKHVVGENNRWSEIAGGSKMSVFPAFQCHVVLFSHIRHVPS